MVIMLIVNILIGILVVIYIKMNLDYRFQYFRLDLDSAYNKKRDDDQYDRLTKPICREMNEFTQNTIELELCDSRGIPMLSEIYVDQNHWDIIPYEQKHGGQMIVKIKPKHLMFYDVIAGVYDYHSLCEKSTKCNLDKLKGTPKIDYDNKAHMEHKINKFLNRNQWAKIKMGTIKTKEKDDE